MKLRITGGVFATVSLHRDAGVWANRSCRAETWRSAVPRWCQSEERGLPDGDARRRRRQARETCPPDPRSDVTIRTPDASSLQHMADVLARPDCAYCVCHPFVALVPYGKTAS